MFRLFYTTSQKLFLGKQIVMSYNLDNSRKVRHRPQRKPPPWVAQLPNQPDVLLYPGTCNYSKWRRCLSTILNRDGFLEDLSMAPVWLLRTSCPGLLLLSCLPLTTDDRVVILWDLRY